MRDHGVADEINQEPVYLLAGQWRDAGFQHTSANLRKVYRAPRVIAHEAELPRE